MNISFNLTVFYQESIYEKNSGKLRSEGEGVSSVASSWHSWRRCHGVTLAKTFKKSFGRERKGRTMDGPEDEERRNNRKSEKQQQTTRGSNLPGRRDFTSEAEANC